MANYYRVKNLPGLKGLVIRGKTVLLGGYDYVNVEEIINTAIVIGDRELRFPFPTGTMLLSVDELEVFENFEKKEFTYDNPFGDLGYEGHWSRGTIHVDYAVYEKGMSINVKDTSVKPVRTVFSQNFYGDYCVDAEESVQHVLKNESDIEELVFSLQDIAAAQKEGMRK